MASKWPSPTNAQALAGLTAFTEPSDALLAIDAGQPSTLALAYYTPTGILPRMRLLACGWTKPGDTFAKPEAPWWKQTYRYPVWSVLRTWVSKTSPPVAVVNDKLASGDAGELSQEMLAVAADLAAIRAAGLDESPPYLIPTAPGALPSYNANAKFPTGACRDKKTGKLRYPRVLCPLDPRTGRQIDPDCKPDKPGDCEPDMIDPLKGFGSGVVVFLIFLALVFGGKK